MDLDESVHLTELTPVILESSDGQQTEVKVACHSVPVTLQHLSSVTNQISEEDSSTLQNCNVKVESVQSDEDFDSITDSPEYRRLQSLYRGLPKEMFVNRILLNEASCDVKLGEMRSHLFEQMKEDDSFPYGLQCMLKRRVATRNGDTVAGKYAYDIHTLISVLEGGEYSDIRELLSSGKGQRSQSSSSVANTTMNGSSDNSVEIKSLTDSLNNLKAEFLNLKQKQIAIEHARSEQITQLKSTISSLKTDLTVLSSTVVRAVTDIRLCAERIESEKSNGVARLKSDLRVLKENVNCMQDVVDNLQYDVTPHVHKRNKPCKKRKSRDQQYRNNHSSTSVGNDQISDTAVDSFVAEASLQVAAYNDRIGESECNDPPGVHAVCHTVDARSGIDLTHSPEGGVSFSATPSAPSGGAQTPGVHAVCHTMDARSGIDLTHSPEGGVSFNATPSAPSGGAQTHHSDASQDSCNEADTVSTCLGAVRLNSYLEHINVDACTNKTKIRHPELIKPQFLHK